MRFAVAAPGLALYPNPARLTTTLELSNLPTGTYQLLVVDATGRVVQTVRYEGGASQPLDVRSLAAGTYLLRFTGTTTDGTPLTLSQRLTKE